MAVVTYPTGSEAIWGIKADGDTFASAKIVSMSKRTSAEREPLLNSDGETVALAIFDEKDELEIELVMEAAITAPALGDAITVGGSEGVVTDVQVRWEQRGWKKLAVQATNWKTIA